MPPVRNNLTVSTPPPVSAADATAAIEGIAARRAKIDDPNAWRLTEDPLEVLTYLRRYSKGVPPWVAEADVLDGLTLRLRLWWLGEEAELWLLESARRLALPPRLIGPRLGITSRQGVHDRLRLAREKLERLTGTPDPALNPGPDQEQRANEQTWLHEQHGAILEIAADALKHRALADEEAADWLLDVARDLRDQVVTPGSLQTLRFALAELETSTGVMDLDGSHPAKELLRRWSELYGTHPS
jgi:hypothetical protein